MTYLDLPHWPALNRTSNFKIFNLLGNIVRELGLDAILSIKVGLDYHNSDRYLIYVSNKRVKHGQNM